MIPFRFRFHGHGSLRYVYRNGDMVRRRMISVKYTTNPKRKKPRFAVVVSKKVLKSAVGRNRIRRRIYEIIRAEVPELQPNIDVAVMVFSAETRTVSHNELKRSIQTIFREAGLYKN